MAPTDRALFLSLRPKYAELLITGEKSVELRRIRPRAEAGALAIIYASTPVRAVLGTCVVDEIGTGKPDLIWRLHGPRTGVRRSEFDAYFRRRSVAVAITVVDPRPLLHPLPLAAVRQGLEDFSPPQSFRYLDPVQVAALLPDEWAVHSAQHSVLAELG